MKKPAYYILSYVYLNELFRESVLAAIQKVKYSKFIEKSSDIDLALLTKHCYQARKLKDTKFIYLFGILILGILTLFIESSFRIPVYIILALSSFVIALFFQMKFDNYLNLIKDKDVLNWPVGGFDQKVIDLVNKYQSESIHYFKDSGPFEKEGYSLGGWSWVVDITKKHKESIMNIKQVDEEELYVFITEKILKLSFEHMEIKDAFYVDALDIYKDRLFYENDLKRGYDSIFLKEWINTRPDNFRYYKSFRITDPGNGQIITFLLRLCRANESLFIEFKYFLLPALPHKFRLIDDFKKSDFRKYLNFLFIGPVLTIVSPYYVFGGSSAIFRIIKDEQLSLLDEQEKKKLIGKNAIVDNLIRGEDYGTYYQIQDKDFYVKAIEKRALNAIIEFLENSNVDVSDFKDSKSQILNNGIMMNGGEMKAASISTGKSNKIKVTSMNGKDGKE